MGENSTAILIVDDDVNLTLNLQDILEAEGYRVAVAPDAETALNLCRENVFDLGFIDMRLPGMSGMELVQKLSELLPRVEYIIITGYASLESAIGAVGRRNLVAYITKPLNMDHLLALITQVSERRHAEEQLQRSQAQYQDLYNSAPVAYYSVGIDGRIKRTNKAGVKFLGYSLEELQRMEFLELYADESKAKAERLFGRFTQGIGWENEEMVYLRKDGQKVHGLLSVSPILDENGRVIESRSVAIDITERKQAEAEIVRLAKFPDENHSPVLRISRDGTILYANQASLPLLDLWKCGVGQHLPEDLYMCVLDVLDAKISRTTEVKCNDRVFSLTLAPVVDAGYANIYAYDITERRQAEEALRDSERKLKEAQAVGKMGNWDYDLATQKIVWSDQVYELYERDKALGPPSADEEAAYYFPEEAARLRDFARRATDAGQALQYDLEARLPSGRTVFLNATMRPIKDSSGQTVKLFGTVQDITERKRAEETLKESEERYRTLFESAAEGILIADVETKKLKYANPAVCKMLGYTLAELTKMSVNDIHPKASLEYVVAEFDAQDRGEKTLSSALPCLKKDGSIIYVDVCAAIAGIGGMDCNVGFFTDVTKRKEMEENLRQSEEKLRLMFESAADGIVVTDLNGLITNVNRIILETHGVKSKENALGRNVVEFVAYRERERAKANLQQLIERRALKGVEHNLVREDGTEYSGELNGNLLEDRSGHPFGLLLLIRDITERKKMEEQLILTDRLASIGELSSGIAHELNNPLTTVIGMSELLLDKDIPSNIKEDLQLVASEAQRAAGVVKNLLTFARKHAPVKQPVNVNSVIEKVLELRAYEQRVSNIQVNTNLTPDLPEIMADYFQLQQVFLNIIINAEYFMTEAHQRGTLAIVSGRVNDTVRVIFIDNGPGIVKEVLGHIFDPFFTTKPVGKGTGLGLSICHGIITEHGGRIYAESEPGKGVTFIVELPIGNTDREAK